MFEEKTYSGHKATRAYLLREENNVSSKFTLYLHVRYWTDIPAIKLGSFNIYDDDGSQNDSLCFKSLRSYSISFNLSNFGRFFLSWILKDCI